MDMGAALRSAREQRGISLDQLADNTKIGLTTLAAIERNEIQKLPGGIFLRGFLRAYAQEVGMDAEETVERYLAQFESHENTAPVFARAPADNSADDMYLLNDAEHVSQASRRDLLFTLLVFALAAVAYLALREPQPTGTTNAPRAMPQSTAVTPVHEEVTLVHEEVGTAGLHDMNALPAETHEVLRLEISAVGPCWVSATVGDQDVVYRLMQAGEQQTIEAPDELVLRVGDPAAFTYVINGVPGRPLGEPGRAVTVRMTAENYRDFATP